MAESYFKGLKTLWEKEKFLVISNFSFSLGVFKSLVQQTSKNQGLFGKELNHLWKRTFVNNVEEGGTSGKHQDFEH